MNFLNFGLTLYKVTNAPTTIAITPGIPPKAETKFFNSNCKIAKAPLKLLILLIALPSVVNTPIPLEIIVNVELRAFAPANAAIIVVTALPTPSSAVLFFAIPCKDLEISSKALLSFTFLNISPKALAIS